MGILRPHHYLLFPIHSVHSFIASSSPSTLPSPPLPHPHPNPLSVPTHASPPFSPFPVPPLEMATKTLHAMYNGGMYDHIGGGFHRYSVDELWHVPHFEKMLYDNPQIARAYLDAASLTGDATLGTAARGVLDYMLREMRHPDGGFYSAQDADSAVRAVDCWTPFALCRWSQLSLCSPRLPLKT